MSANLMCEGDSNNKTKGKVNIIILLINIQLHKTALRWKNTSNTSDLFVYKYIFKKDINIQHKYNQFSEYHCLPQTINNSICVHMQLLTL